MNEKKENAKERFSPVIKKFRRIRIQTPYKDECWRVDLIDRSSLSKYNKHFKLIFAMFDNHIKYAWAIPVKAKSGQSTTTAIKNLKENARKNLIRFGQKKVKSLMMGCFYTS